MAVGGQDRIIFTPYSSLLALFTVENMLTVLKIGLGVWLGGKEHFSVSRGQVES